MTNFRLLCNTGFVIPLSVINIIAILLLSPCNSAIEVLDRTTSLVEQLKSKTNLTVSLETVPEKTQQHHHHPQTILHDKGGVSSCTTLPIVVSLDPWSPSPPRWNRHICCSGSEAQIVFRRRPDRERLCSWGPSTAVVVMSSLGARNQECPLESLTSECVTQCHRWQ